MTSNKILKSQPLKITIVAHGLRAGGGVSVGKNLISGLTQTLPNAQFQIFISEGRGFEQCVKADVNCTWVEYKQKFSLIGRWLYDQTRLIREIESFLPSVIICLGNIGVPKKISPQILLVHDAHLFYPSNHYSRESLRQLLIYYFRRQRFSRDIKKTTVLLCQTKTAINRISQQYAFTRETQLLPNAISVDSLSGSTAASIKLPKTRENAFNIFYLTRYYPHKNIEIFIDIFVKYRNELRDVVLYLTIDKNQHTLAQKLLKSISDNQLSKNIVNIGPIQQKDIAGYFRSMHAMVMPTTLESFSGSYLEAMAFKCPILTSNLDFAHEVCGDAALYFDPWSADSLYAALRKVIDDPTLSNTLIERGTQVLNQNSRTWKQNSEELATTILKLAAHN